MEKKNRFKHQNAYIQLCSFERTKPDAYLHYKSKTNIKRLKVQYITFIEDLIDIKTVNCDFDVFIIKKIEYDITARFVYTRYRHELV